MVARSALRVRSAHSLGRLWCSQESSLRDAPWDKAAAPGAAERDKAGWGPCPRGRRKSRKRSRNKENDAINNTEPARCWKVLEATADGAAHPGLSFRPEGTGFPKTPQRSKGPGTRERLRSAGGTQVPGVQGGRWAPVRAASPGALAKSPGGGSSAPERATGLPSRCRPPEGRHCTPEMGGFDLGREQGSGEEVGRMGKATSRDGAIRADSSLFIPLVSVLFPLSHRNWM